MAEIVVRPRMGGKTSTAIRWLLEDPHNRVIFCDSNRHANEVRRQVRRALGGAMDPVEIRAILMTSVVYHPEQLRGRQRQVFVDDADNVLNRFLGGGLAGATWNED